MSRLVALYPRAWRDRYEIEFRALMAERPPTTTDRLDVLRGAIDARLHPQVGRTDPAPSSAIPSGAVAGAMAVLGGVLWALSGVAFYVAPYNVDFGYKESGSSVLLAVAGATLTALAVVAVARFLPGRHVLLTAAASGSLLGAVALLLPWPVVVIGFWVTIAGTVMFGLLSTPRLGLTGILVAGAAVLALGVNTEDERALLLVPLGAAWALLGIVLAIRGMPATVEGLPTSTTAGHDAGATSI